MLLKFNLFSVLLIKHFATCFINEEISQKFAIFAPTFIQPNTKYTVAVFTENLEENIVINLKLCCGSLVYSSIDQEMAGEKSDTMEIDIEQLPSKTCTLNVKVKGIGAAWDSTTDLYSENKIIYVSSKSPSILIQLEKRIYKPGEIVKYRIIFLNRQLLPVSAATGAEIKILDSKSNIIRLHKNESILKGLFSGEMKLANEPNLGNWEISAKLIDKEEKLKFSVVKYLTPQFKVEVKLAPYIVNGTSNITAEIKAKDYYGKEIKGEVTTRLKIPPNNNYKLKPDKITQQPSLIRIPMMPQTTITISQVTMPIDGSVFIDLEIPNDARFMTRETENIIFSVEASVMESYSGIEETATGKVQMFAYPYKIEMIEYPKYYQPGFTLNFTFKVAEQDNTPVSDDEPDAFQLSHGFSYEDSDSIFKSSIPATGLVKFSAISPSNENLIVKSMTASYEAVKATFPIPEKISSATKTYISVSIEGDYINVKTNKPMNSVNYLAVSQGQIVASGREKVVPENTEASITLNLIKEKVRGPKVNVVVFSVMGINNEIVFDSASIIIPMTMTNYLKIKLSKEKVEPGENVTFSSQTNSNSIIALRAVEQPLRPPKEYGNIDSNRIEEFVENFDRGIKTNERFGTSLASRILEDVRIRVFTDCYLEEELPADLPVSYQNIFKSVMELKKISKILSPVARSPQIQTISMVPDEFSESWIWETIDAVNTTVEISKIVPHTLKSWVLTGFSLNPELGIGINLTPEILETFRPFFISFSLPYSVKIGSIFAMEIMLHNYINEELSGVVVFKNFKKEFTFVESVSDSDIIKTSVEKGFEVPPLQVSSVTFIVKFLKVGDINLEIEAKTDMAGDSISKSLKVIPGGIKQSQNSAVLLDLREGKPVKLNLSPIFPDERPDYGDSVKFLLIGDLLGSPIINLDKLIELPLGCGEQVMVNFVPSIIILDYLKTFGTLTQSVKEEAINFLQIGYQTELTYRNSDGSFSSFSNSRSAGSTWLTAFVVRSFISAKEYITIDEKIITSGLEYLAKLQKANGVFLERDHAFRFEIEARQNSAISLTAHVLLTFLEAQKRKTFFKYKSLVRKALDFLSYKIGDLEDPYATILICYAFHLANHHNKDYAYKKVKKFSTHISEHHHTYWTSLQMDNLTNISNFTSNVNVSNLEKHPSSIEMTAYALLIFLMRNKIVESFPIVKWLLAQRNSNGGFLSTQDTQVALTALAKFAITTKPPINFQMFVSLEHMNGVQQFHVSKENEMVLQEFILPSETREVAISASGKGMAMAQLSWSFYVSSSYDHSWNSPFNLKTEFGASEERAGKFALNISFELDEGKSAHVLVMEVNLPSGFIFDSKNLAKLLKIDTIMRFEEENDHSKLIIYFTLLTHSEICVNIDAFRLHTVSDVNSVPIILYDYHDTTRKDITFYQPSAFPLCEMCSVNGRMCDEDFGC